MTTPMKRMIFFHLVLLVIGATAIPGQQVTRQWTFGQETGVVFGGNNNIWIPGESETRFSLSRDIKTESKFFYRISLGYAFSRRHTVIGMYAPLNLSAFGTFREPVSIQGVVFPADSAMSGTYRFNTFRVTYRYNLVRSPNWEVGIGATGLVRDAAINLSGASRFAEKKNVGFVPLLHFRVARSLDANTRMLLEGDALAAPQGRAEDVLLAVQYRPISNFLLQLGYRFLEGRSDKMAVFSSALFHYATAGAILEF